MLTGNEIKIQVAAGRIAIEPFDEKCIGPNSYDVHLSDTLLVYTEAVLDPKQDNRYREIKIPTEGIVLLPGRVYLGSTVEYTESPFHIPMYEGRNSLGRLGLESHKTAGFGDIGFCGTWTLELGVVQPTRIYPWMRIGQLYWHNPDGEVLARYAGKYQGQRDATPSRLFQDREWKHELAYGSKEDWLKIIADFVTAYEHELKEAEKRAYEQIADFGTTYASVLKAKERCVCGQLDATPSLLFQDREWKEEDG